MKMKNQLYVPPCFSGECGHCMGCCGNAIARVSASEMDGVDRGRVLAKFPQKPKEDLEAYMNEINQIRYREQECTPNPDETITGVVPKEFKVSGKLFRDSEVYKLLKTPHGALCDTPRCKVHYVNAPEFFHMSWFTSIPMYTRKRDDSHQMCIKCVKEVGSVVLPKC